WRGANRDTLSAFDFVRVQRALWRRTHLPSARERRFHSVVRLGITIDRRKKHEGQISFKSRLGDFGSHVVRNVQSRVPGASPIIGRRPVAVQAPRWLRCDRGGYG